MRSSRLDAPDVSHDTVCRVVRDTWRAHGRAELLLSVGLRRLFRDNVHRGRGFSQFADFRHEFIEALSAAEGKGR